jgi:hypothetical protein
MNLTCLLEQWASQRSRRYRRKKLLSYFPVETRCFNHTMLSSADIWQIWIEESMLSRMILTQCRRIRLRILPHGGRDETKPRSSRINFSNSVPRDGSSNGVYPDWFRGERARTPFLQTNGQSHSKVTPAILI